MDSAVFWSHSPMNSFHALPKFIPPRQSGLTLTDAVGASRRYWPKAVFGGGGGLKAIVEVVCTEV
jgi:hypothetical protein